VAELRGELMKKQREFVGIRLDMEDYQYQIQTLTNSGNMQKKTIAEYQERLINEREEYDLMAKEFKMRERKYQEQIALLQDENERKSTLTETKAVSFATTYSEEEMSSVR
jgi:AICAR transformylase/IMP cyclohydrolase PurH